MAPLFASRCCGLVVAGGYGPGNLVKIDPGAETDADVKRVGYCPACDHREPLLDRLEVGHVAPKPEPKEVVDG